MRIVIAATHRMFASALGSLLRRSGHDIAGYATDPGAMADIIARERADACVVDADVAWESGAMSAAISLAMAVSPGTAFVVLTDDAGSAGLSRALSAGVHGAVLKSDDYIEFLRVLTAARGRVARRPGGGAVLSLSLHAARRAMRSWPRQADVGSSLTPREHEVLARLVRGESTSVMARSMGVRPSTTRTHIDALLMKLGVHSRIEAVALAVREGIVNVADGGTGWNRSSTRPSVSNADEAAHRR